MTPRQRKGAAQAEGKAESKADRKERKAERAAEGKADKKAERRAQRKARRKAVSAAKAELAYDDDDDDMLLAPSARPQALSGLRLDRRRFAAYNAEEKTSNPVDASPVRRRRRKPLPCPCPEDELVLKYELNRRRAAEYRKVDLKPGPDGEVDVDLIYGPPMEEQDQRGYCNMIAKLRGLDTAPGYKTPIHQRLRNRLVTEQTWFELQARMFLKPPITNDRPTSEVLAMLEKKKTFSAGKERGLWRQDMTASAARGSGPAYTVFWGHAPKARLCACPDTPCRCQRTRAMPRVFTMPKGRATKRVARPSLDLPYVVDRLRRTVELDRRFYIKVAERGLMDCIRPEVCIDECVPYFKPDKRTAARAYEERCDDLTRKLRDTCLDDDCDVCDEMVEEEESETTSSEDNFSMVPGMDDDGEFAGPCRAKCASPQLAAAADAAAVAAVANDAPPAPEDTPASATVVATAEASGRPHASTSGRREVKILNRLRTYFHRNSRKGAERAPPAPLNPLRRPQKETAVGDQSDDPATSSHDDDDDDDSEESSDASADRSDDGSAQGPWPAPPLTAMMALGVPRFTIMQAGLAEGEEDDYPSAPPKAEHPPANILIKDECPDREDMYNWYKRVFLLWVFDIKDTHRTRSVQVTEQDIATAYDPTLISEDYIDPERLKKMKKKMKKTEKKEKGTNPINDKMRQEKARRSIDRRKREARAIKKKQAIKDKHRKERAKRRAKKKKEGTSVICECKAREYRIIEARKLDKMDPKWANWCPPDSTPESSEDFEDIMPEDVPLKPPPPPGDVRDLMVQIDMPPMEPGTVLSDEVLELDELEMMGSVESLAFGGKPLKPRRDSVREVLDTGEENRPEPKPDDSNEEKKPNTQTVSFTKTLVEIRPYRPPRPKRLIDIPPPRVRQDIKETIMQTDSEPGPLREKSLPAMPAIRSCVCKPSEGQKCTCKADDDQSGCTCKIEYGRKNLNTKLQGPSCICKPKHLRRKRKRCASKTCKKCRDTIITGRDKIAKTRTKQDRAKEEKEKIRMEKAKLKALKRVARNDYSKSKSDQARERQEMKQAAAKLKEQLRERKEEMKEQEAREKDREKRLKLQLKLEKAQEARDENFRRRLSELRRPEAEFCGCADWQKGLCRIKVPPDLEEKEAREAAERIEKYKRRQEKKALLHADNPLAFTASVDITDSEFVFTHHRHTLPRRSKDNSSRKHQIKSGASLTATKEISRDIMHDPVFDIGKEHRAKSDSDCSHDRTTYSRLLDKRSSSNHLLHTSFPTKNTQDYYVTMKSRNYRSETFNKNKVPKSSALANGAHPRMRQPSESNSYFEDSDICPAGSISTVSEAASVTSRTPSLQQAKRSKPSKPQPKTTRGGVIIQKRSEDTINIADSYDKNQKSQQNDGNCSSMSKNVLHKFAHKVFNKRNKDISREDMHPEQKLHREHSSEKGNEKRKVSAQEHHSRKPTTGRDPINESSSKNLVASFVRLLKGPASRPKTVAEARPAERLKRGARAPAPEPAPGRPLGRPVGRPLGPASGSVEPRKRRHLLASARD